MCGVFSLNDAKKKRKVTFKPDEHLTSIHEFEVDEDDTDSLSLNVSMTENL